MKKILLPILLLTGGYAAAYKSLGNFQYSASYEDLSQSVQVTGKNNQEGTFKPDNSNDLEMGTVTIGQDKYIGVIVRPKNFINDYITGHSYTDEQIKYLQDKYKISSDNPEPQYIGSFQSELTKMRGQRSAMSMDIQGKRKALRRYLSNNRIYGIKKSKSK